MRYSSTDQMVRKSCCEFHSAENHTRAPQIHQNLYIVILADTPIHKPSPIYRYMHQLLKLYLTGDSTVTYWLFITFVVWWDIQWVLNLSRNQSSQFAVCHTNCCTFHHTFAPYFPIHGCPPKMSELILQTSEAGFENPEKEIFENKLPSHKLKFLVKLSFFSKCQNMFYKSWKQVLKILKRKVKKIEFPSHDPAMCCQCYVWCGCAWWRVPAKIWIFE